MSKNKNAAKQPITPKTPQKGTTAKQKNITVPPPPKNKDRVIKPYVTWGLLFIISLITFIAYQPALDNDFVNWDDTRYVVDIETRNGITTEKVLYPYLTDISFESIKKMFFAEEGRYHMGNYHPLAMLSLAIDYQLYEWNPKGYHLTNIIIHIINTILVFWFFFFFLKQLQIWRAWEMALITALLFGVHTLHVESVAWVSERKDVLYTLFFLASLVSYVLYIQKEKYSFLFLSLLFFLLSLFSKAQAVSLAGTLVAVDFILKRKIFSIKVILEKIPYFALGILFGIIALKAQSTGDAIRDTNEFDYIYRIFFACYGFTMYIVKLIAPHNMAAIYPYPVFVNGAPPAFYNFFVIPMLFFIGAFIVAFRKNKLLAFGMAFFVINIILLLQLIPVGSAVMADRYVYIPSIGFFFMVAVGVNSLADYKNSLLKPLVAVVVVYALILTVLSRKQTDVWQNSITLWTHSVSIAPDAEVAWNNRGSARNKVNDSQGALSDFTTAVTLKPTYSSGWYNRGTTLKDMERYAEAISDFNNAIANEPGLAEAYQNRGIAHERMGDALPQADSIAKREAYLAALNDYNKGIELRPDLEGIFSSRGVIKGKFGDLKAAIEDFDKSIALKPSAEAFSNRGFAYAQLGNTEQAINDYNTSITLNPANADAYYNRAMSFYTLEKWDNALKDLTSALKYRPNTPLFHYYRAYTYIKINDNANACADFQQAKQLGFTNLDALIAQYCK